MSRSEKRARGDLGEEIAARYLTNRGFSVQERNYWKPWGEIDLIADKGGCIRFIEVKTIRSGGGSHETLVPEDNLHAEKLERIHRAVQSYLWERRIPDDTLWQLDAVCIRLDQERKKAFVELIENI